MDKPLWRWTRLVPQKWEDAWAERLRFLGPDRVMFIGWPGSRSLRVEAFADEATVQLLVTSYGGKASRARQDLAKPTIDIPPLNIRGRLVVCSSERDLLAHRESKPSVPAILIPPGMAFGTGDHATTASCLRLLADSQTGLEAPWDFLDAGCGSGILAIAASAFGARNVDAFDFDPAAVRIAKANAKLNQLRGIKIQKNDIRDWTPPRLYRVIAANLFSDLLAASAPILRSALHPGGTLIFSGVLRGQLDTVQSAFAASGLNVDQTIIRGKWSAGRATAIQMPKKSFAQAKTE